MTQLQAERETTLDDLLALPDDGKLYELLRGHLVEKKVGALAIWIASRIAYMIEAHVETTRRGWAMTELIINCFPSIAKHARRPDVAYFHRERLPVPTEDSVTAAPNFVVEVLSQHDNAIEVDLKVEEYIEAGVELVWIVNPSTRTVRVHKSGGAVRVFHESDTISAEPVLPDFSSIVREFFPEAQVSPAAKS